MVTASKFALIGALVGAAAGCGYESGANKQQGDVETAVSSLTFAGGCNGAPAHQSLTGGGSFRVTDPSYTATNCADAYLVDLTDYATTYNFGTTIAYDEPAPTSATACRNTKLTVSVNQRATPPFFVILGEKTSTGIWYVDPANNGHCRMPRITLEDSFPTIRPNNSSDYRIAIRAYENASSGFTKKRFAFASVKSEPDAVTMESILAGIAISRTAISPWVHRLWQRKGTAGLGVLCRASSLEASLLTFGATSLINAGAAAADVTARNAGYASMRKELCNNVGSESAFQTAVKDYFGATLRVRDALAARYKSPATVLGRNETRMAEMLINKLSQLDVGRLAANCNPSPVDLWKFLNSAAQPPGSAPDRLILGSCSTSSADGPAQVAARLGVGGGRTITDTQTVLASCLAPVIKGQTTDVCNDPRAAGAADERAAPPPSSDDDIPCFEADHNMAPCTSTDKTSVITLEPFVIIGNLDETQKDEEIVANVAQTPDANRAAEVAQAEKDAKDEAESAAFWLSLGEAIAKDLKLIPGINTLIVLLKEQAKEWDRNGGYACIGDATLYNCVTIPKAQPKPGSPTPNQYCGTDFAPGGWYPAFDAQLTTVTSMRELDEYNRIEHCMCKAMEASYDKLANALPGIKVSLGCPTQREKLEQDCLSDPGGPDDRPRAECKSVLFPGQIDDITWDAKICNAALCPAGQVKSILGTGCCGPPLNILGGNPGSTCPQGLISNCPPDNPGPCLCEPVDLGGVPYAGEPECRLEPTAFPGSLKRWLLPDANTLGVHRAGSENFLVMKTGSAGHASSVTPTYFPTSFDQTGTVVRPRALVSKTPVSGVNLHLYCTNPDAGLFRGDMGKCSLTGLTAGTPGSCDITLNSSLRSACLGGPFNFEWVAEAPPSWNGLVGVGRPDFGGTLTVTPPSVLPPRCPLPGPDTPFVPAERPLWLDLGGTPDLVIQNFTLASGLSTLVSPTIFERP